MAFLKSFEVIQRFKQFRSTRRAFLKFCEEVRQYPGVGVHAYFRGYRDLYNQYDHGRKAPFEEFWAELVNLGFEYPRNTRGLGVLGGSLPGVASAPSRSNSLIGFGILITEL